MSDLERVLGLIELAGRESTPEHEARAAGVLAARIILRCGFVITDPSAVQVVTPASQEAAAEPAVRGEDPFDRYGVASAVRNGRPFYGADGPPDLRGAAEVGSAAADSEPWEVAESDLRIERDGGTARVVGPALRAGRCARCRGSYDRGDRISRSPSGALHERCDAREAGHDV